MTSIFKGNLERLTLNNKAYRRVLCTTRESQLVVMNLEPGQDIGEEVHQHTSQFIRVEAGSALATVDRQQYRLTEGDAIVIPSGAHHNIKAGRTGLQIYTIYSPPEHEDDLIEWIKAS